MTTCARLARAKELHRGGQLPDARRLYAELLAEEPASAAARFSLGLLELQDGHPERALPLIAASVADDGGELRYRLGHAHVLAALGRWGEAAAAYRHVLAIDPALADAHYALGVALQSQADYPAAIAAYGQALVLAPELADAHSGLGICRQLAGQPAAAEAAYRAALALRPGDPAVLSNLGVLLGEAGRTDEALALLRAAAEREPLSATHAVNLAVVLCRRREFAAALAVLRHADACDADNAEVAYNLGIAYQGLGQLDEAAHAYRRAVALRPAHAAALNNLGNACRELGDLPAAAAAYEAAIRAEPASAVARNNAGCLLRALGRLEEAEAVLRAGLALDPGEAALHDNLGSVLKDAGDLEAAIACYRRALELDPGAAATHSNLAYALSFEAADPGVALAECRRWDARFAAPLASGWREPDVDDTPGRRLRVGYVSADFREHCQSLFTIPLLAHHDRAAFEIHCYSSVPRPDARTRTIAACADAWRDVRRLDDAALAERIRADRIDILVDLTMHMANGRPLVFARRPAPVQIAWLAYPGTTGLAAMDYRLSDPRLDPAGFDAHYAEQTLRLPDAFWCYDPLSEPLAVGELPALRHGHVTFGCLNNPCKLSEATLALWAAVLARLPAARLLLLAPPGRYRARLLGRLARRGVAAARVGFVPYRPRAEYLRSYADIDLCLDTVPYNGHTTSLDALWMGVPVVSRVGRTAVGRGGLSQLYQVGLAELAADTDQGFVEAAVGLARDLPALAALRLGLRGRLERSPLMDAARFARAVEAAYRQAWRQRAAGRVPALRSSARTA
ncbi:MAG TPA: tetratricopeptide repeat protein [Steroidobacteraceae bacterium]|nr:tetratricopeptide repeat protein [Steroidobacteraceae bacterium]